MSNAAQLVKGQNLPVTGDDVVVRVDGITGADVSALLVTESGKVRSDADFVFFNQPAAPGVQLLPGTPGALAVSLAQVPPAIERIRAVLTLEDANSSFGRLPAPTATLTDRAGNPLCQYRIEGLGPETVVIAVELYRRGGQWKIRAVGQGYAGGFADLVTDHGVTVDDAPSSTSQAQPAGSPPPVNHAPAGQYPPCGRASSRVRTAAQRARFGLCAAARGRVPAAFGSRWGIPAALGPNAAGRLSAAVGPASGWWIPTAVSESGSGRGIPAASGTSAGWWLRVALGSAACRAVPTAVSESGSGWRISAACRVSACGRAGSVRARCPDGQGRAGVVAGEAAEAGPA